MGEHYEAGNSTKKTAPEQHSNILQNVGMFLYNRKFNKKRRTFAGTVRFSPNAPVMCFSTVGVEAVVGVCGSVKHR